MYGFIHHNSRRMPLNDEEHMSVENKKGNRCSFACFLEVKRLKTGVFQLKDLPDKAQNI